MFVAVMAMSTVSAYSYAGAGARTYESYDRTYDYTISENRDSSSTSTYGLGNRFNRGYSNTYSDSYSRTERLQESIRSDTYTRYDDYNRGGRYGSSYGRYDQNYGSYAGNYPRSRYRYGPSNRYNYNPFGYYQARPSYRWIY